MSGPATFAMIDWSGVPDRGPRPKRDAIWAAVSRGGLVESPVYLRGIAVAEAWIVDLIAEETAHGRPLLIGADFPFGYPRGMAERLTGSPALSALWSWFADAFDALPPDRGRFDLAGEINGLFPGDGPFWFNGLRRDVEGLPRGKPSVPPPGFDERRKVEAIERGAFTCWQMGGAGAVGSQAMTGMALIGRLKRRFGDTLSVWPFEDEAAVRLVEIWPSLLSRQVEERIRSDPGLPRDGGGRVVKDAAQVLVLVEAVSRAAARGDLRELLDAGSPEARATEGWILGAGQDGLAYLLP